MSCLRPSSMRSNRFGSMAPCISKRFSEFTSSTFTTQMRLQQYVRSGLTWGHNGLFFLLNELSVVFKTSFLSVLLIFLFFFIALLRSVIIAIDIVESLELVESQLTGLVVVFQINIIGLSMLQKGSLFQVRALSPWCCRFLVTLSWGLLSWNLRSNLWVLLILLLKQVFSQLSLACPWFNLWIKFLIKSMLVPIFKSVVLLESSFVGFMSRLESAPWLQEAPLSSIYLINVGFGLVDLHAWPYLRYLRSVTGRLSPVGLWSCNIRVLRTHNWLGIAWVSSMRKDRVDMGLSSESVGLLIK